MRILITGASGFVGRALTAKLEGEGHEVWRLTRHPQSAKDLRWSVDSGSLDLSNVPPFAAVVHLAGENVAGGRWSERRKAEIMNSRVRGTRLLCETLAGLALKPETLLSASGISYYQSDEERIHDETSPLGRGFLAEVCREWEAATEPASSAGIRVAQLRIGIVLGPEGGALAKMLPAFRLGMGGRLGHGRQRMSWVSLDDLLGIIGFLLSRAELHGPFNAVSPTPVTNAEFTQALGRALRRPTMLPVPAWVLRTAFGEMAEPMLLGDLAVMPKRLRDAGFAFRHAALEAALAQALGTGPESS